MGVHAGGPLWIVPVFGGPLFTMGGAWFLWPEWRTATARADAAVAKYNLERERALLETDRIKHRRPPRP